MRRLSVGLARALCAPLTMLMTALWLNVAGAQPAGCDQGIVRMPDSTGTVLICSALAAKVPELSRQLGDAAKAIGSQQAQIRELARLVKGLNVAAASLGANRQGQLLTNLSSELGRAERAGGDRPARTLDDLSDQLDGLRDQLITGLGNEKSAAATQAALQGAVGDSIARLEIRSAGRQLDEISQRLQALQADVSSVKAGMASANDKLDRIGNAVDPARAADRCGDLHCAVMGGASAAAVQRLLDKGARLSGNRINDGELLKVIALVPNPDRFQILDMLAQRGLDRGMMFFPYMTDRTTLTTEGFQLAQQFELAAPANRSPRHDLPGMDPGLSDWNDMAGCLYRTSGGVSLIELAALLGDRDLFQHLKQRQVALPTRSLSCKWFVLRRDAAVDAPFTSLAIEQASGKVRIGNAAPERLQK